MYCSIASVALIYSRVLRSICRKTVGLQCWLCNAVAFRMYDIDGDDKISREELLEVLHMMVGVNISDEQVSGVR